jgi:hypothetical protein
MVETISHRFSSASTFSFRRNRQPQIPAIVTQGRLLPPALEKGFDIIELLAAAPDGLTSSGLRL